MDEMSVWFEVVRAIMPQRYSVRLSREGRALLVTSPSEDRLAWVGESELAALSPTRAIDLIESRLSQPESHIAARFAEQVAF
jgi:hypothetical protein